MEIVYLSGIWNGWHCEDKYLVDDAGNKYLPNDIRSTFYGKQLYQIQVGEKNNIKFLKQELENLIKEKKAKTIDESLTIIENSIKSIRMLENINQASK